jgi:hypothetical protein
MVTCFYHYRNTAWRDNVTHNILQEETNSKRAPPDSSMISTGEKQARNPLR